MLTGPKALDALTGVRRTLLLLADASGASPRFRGTLEGAQVEAEIVVRKKARPAVLIEAGPTHAEVGIPLQSAHDLAELKGPLRAGLTLRRPADRSGLKLDMEVVATRSCLRGVRLSLKALGSRPPDAGRLARLLNTRRAVRVSVGAQEELVVPFRTTSSPRIRFALVRDVSVLGFGLAVPASAEADLALDQPVRFCVHVPGSDRLRLAGSIVRIVPVQPPKQAAPHARPFLDVGVRLGRAHAENEHVGEVLGAYVIHRQLAERRKAREAG